MRFLDLKLLKGGAGLITQIGNVVLLSNNRVRFFIRLVSAATAGVLSSLLGTILYGILINIIF